MGTSSSKIAQSKVIEYPPAHVEDASVTAFSAFLKSKGNDIFYSHEEFHVMPEEKRREIMSRFGNAPSVDVTPTRSFPHQWSFSAGGNEIQWTGPDM
mmetsp:Transcript_31976/g.76431  ORF Transcript_31976/g.76431 Transcript_31976/m.76431 type:complete len:97 (-) Transcript_31976:256-546(-)|eukprot:CAMPEP_0177697300 /NCGR_PEP_ID=MMETSP0484_2-20121128/4441_1 /TAXON_ID=354590 /ORGANISM="Rhodomonas lens, Strain RHODO" /LENGTH=96 /DNA_ID=CAMNT_0019208331 /DNA_START=66 /DNA_END=356 /DNA_ORIENTATION=+